MVDETAISGTAPMRTPGFDAANIEEKWQKRWQDSGIWQAVRDENKKKFFLMFAYPGVSGYLHVGHMRGYTYSDVITRYKRMTGYNVLFPVGAHASGNVAITFARKIERNSQDHIDILKANGCPDAEIEKLKDPDHVVKFFSDVYLNDYWKKFGFLADWRRFTTTVDPGYKKFIEWQFRKLNDAGLLIQKPYYGTACMECGPVAVDASETDISRGGNAEKQLWTLLKFRMGDEFVLAATLRPETVYGQTNFWVDPDVEYVKAKVGREVWILSSEAVEKLSFQMDDIKVIDKIHGRELVGKKVIAPVIEREIPILPSSFTDPNLGTGLVTSVPSDAPYDWIALSDLSKDEETCAKYGLDCEEIKAIRPIPIIDSKGWGPNPAVEIVEKMGIKNQDDLRLEEATQEIYKVGFHTGRMNSACGEYAGMPVAQAKEAVRDMMIAIGVADLMYDLSEPVICRCGGKVIVKQIPDQWFINYGDGELTRNTLSHVEEMNIMPQEYKDNLPGILEWFKERACARLGNWLGTTFPFDKRWIIEPISDSTLYSAYYIITPYINSGKLAPDQMNEKFFDFIYRDIGTSDEVSASTGIDPNLLAEIKKDFEYWYPIDVNLGGKEHMTVHFPVYLMNHAAILKPEDFPRGIYVNWWFIMSGGKMSKSKGGAKPIPDAASLYTVDGMRLYYCHIANPHADVEWDPASVRNSRQRIERVWKFANELVETKGGEERPIDAWLESRIHMNLANAATVMEDFKLREAANIIYFEMLSDLRWYLRRGGNNSQLINRALDVWIRLMAPFTPHLAEELWEKMGNNSLVSIASFPEASDFEVDETVIMSEEYVREVQADITGILKMTGIKPSRICIYTAPEWKLKMLKMGLDILHDGRIDMGQLMKQAMADDELKTRSKEVSQLAGRLMKDASKFGEADIARLETDFDETAFLKSASPFFVEEFKCEVLVFSADDADSYDPQNKKNAANPFKPAIYIE